MLRVTLGFMGLAIATSASAQEPVQTYDDEPPGEGDAEPSQPAELSEEGSEADSSGGAYGADSDGGGSGGGDDADGASHGGFYMRLGIGLGYYSSTADIAGSESNYSGMTIPYEILLGGSLFDGLVLGGGVTIDHSSSPTLEIDGTEATGVEFSQYVVSITSFVDFYPDPTDGWHGQVRFGWGGLETSTEGGGAGGSDPTGMVLGLGGGYDYWVTDGLGVGGLARLLYAPISLNSVDYPTTAFAVTANLVFY